jgi:hypothetical protein
MYFENLNFNFSAILVCIVVNTFTAILWYSPLVFGKPWSKITGQSIEGAPEPKKLIPAVICTIIFVFTLAFLIDEFKIQYVSQAIVFAFIIGIGITATATLPMNMYNGNKIRLFLIDTGYSVCITIICSIILVLMK